VIFLNFQLRDGTPACVRADQVAGIGQDADGYAFIELASGSRWTTGVHEPVQVETGEIEKVDVAGVQVTRKVLVTLSPVEQLRQGIGQVLEQAGQTISRRNSVARPGVVGIG
jgi:hypothetical protein